MWAQIAHADTPTEAERIIDAYVAHYNHERPHSACAGYPRIWLYNYAGAREMLGLAVPGYSQPA